MFLAADTVALIVQAVGGAKAAAANTLGAANAGAHIMLGGIVFQLVALVLYVALAAEFFVRAMLCRAVHPSSAARAPALAAGEPQLCGE